jgi:type VI secretion system secreted protein Hcp
MFDVFMKIKGAKSGEIKGYSTNEKHKDWIEVLSYEHAMESPVGARHGTASGKVQFNPIKVKKQIDGSTPVLYQALTTNENLTEVLFEFWTSGATGGLQKYLDIKLVNARLTHVSMSLNPSTDDVKLQQALVTQTIAMSYDTMIWTHSGFAIDGASLGGPKTAEVKWSQM